MDKMFEVVQHLIFMLIGGTVGTSTYTGLLTPLTTAVINNPLLVIPLGVMILGIVFAVISKLFGLAKK